MNYYSYLSNVTLLKLQSLPANSLVNPIIIDQCRFLAIDLQSSLIEEAIDNSVKIYKVDVHLNKREVPLHCFLDKSNSQIINIQLSNKAPLEEGVEYELNVTLSSGNICIYIAIDYNINLELSNTFINENKRKLILCLSDIHLGIDDSYGQFKSNRRYLHNFLSKLRFSPNLKELVFNGDLFDQWFIPGDIDTLSGKSSLNFLERIVENNREIINDIRNIIADKEIKVTYIPGNHDMLFTSAEINSIFPGINQARDSYGLGSYTPEDLPNSIIEHGHRYDFFCAPNHISTTEDNCDFLLPPGYFYARISATSFIENLRYYDDFVTDFTLISNTYSNKNYLEYLYKSICTFSLRKCPVMESNDEKFIYTHINGYKENYCINDLLPNLLNKDKKDSNKLFKDITLTWNKRQIYNKVPVSISTEAAIKYSIFHSYFDNMAQIQYFKNPQSKKRIVIFGHTHCACMIISNNSLDQKTIYANCGSWLDKSSYAPSMTFTLLIPPKDKTSPNTFIHLYRYKGDNSIEKLQSQAVTEFSSV